MKKWPYLSSWVMNKKTKVTLLSQTLKVEEKKVSLFFFIGESYLAGQSRQIKNYLAGRSCQIKNYLAGQSCQIKYYLAGQYLQVRNYLAGLSQKLKCHKLPNTNSNQTSIDGLGKCSCLIQYILNSVNVLL